jgi:hypothetical protein
VTELLLFLLVVGNYGLGLRRDGLPLGGLVGAAVAVYWALRLGGGYAFVALGESVGRHPTLLGEATMAAIGPAAALCAYAVVRLLERRVLARLEADEREHAGPAATPDAAAAAPAAASAIPVPTEAPAPPADPCPLLPGPGRSPRPRLSDREEWALALGLIAAGVIIFSHTLATARAYWREDLTDAARQALSRRADEARRLEERLLRCGSPASARDRDTYQRVLDETARAGMLRVGARPAAPADVLANLERERAARCGAPASRPP